MNRLEAIRHIAKTFDNDKWETTINDEERAEHEQLLIDCLAALGVTPEEYEAAFVEENGLSIPDLEAGNIVPGNPRVQARIQLAESGATVDDIRMAIREQLIYGGYSFAEADALILLHEAAVTRV